MKARAARGPGAVARRPPGVDERQFELLVRSVVDYAIYMLDPEGRVMTWNAGAERITGYRADEALGHSFERFYTPEDRAAGLPQRGLEIAAREGRFEREGWRVRKDGSRFRANVVLHAIHDEERRLLGFAKVTHDITASVAAQQAILESERQFRLLVEGVTDYAIFMLDPTGHVASWNTGAQRIKGYSASEIIGQHLSRFYSKEDRAAGVPQAALATAEREGRIEMEGWRVRRDGTRFWANVIIDRILDESGKLLGFAKVTRDVTERRETQQRLDETRNALAQSQKMEAVGQLTGGIAHDFNNLLTVVIGNLEIIERDASDPDRVRHLVEAARRAAERGAKLTQQLLSFARRQALRPTEANVNRLVHAFEAVLRRACGETIHVDFDLAPRLATTQLDPTQFEAAILNLVVNARDAMPQGGRLRIATRNVTVKDARAARLKIAPGPYVEVIVEDNGTGMAPEVRERALDPFYTTKDVGKGTGLGLSQVYGFVTQSGGGLELRSEIGSGTSVVLLLPRSNAAEEEKQASRARGTSPSSRGTVLIVEDDPDVLQTTIATVQSLGYEVLTAADAQAALAILARDEPIDILFSDIVMPKGIDGIQLAREASAIRPGIRVVLASGYPRGALSDRGLSQDFGFIAKPYRWSDLAEMLRQAVRK